MPKPHQADWCWQQTIAIDNRSRAPDCRRLIELSSPGGPFGTKEEEEEEEDELDPCVAAQRHWLPGKGIA